jgi:signal transduction histidine kinase
MKLTDLSLFRSFRFRLIASVVTIEVIMLSLLVWNNILIIHSTHTDRLRDTAASMIQQIANTAGNYMVAVDYATLEEYLKKIISYKELSYIVILDRDEDIVTSLGKNIPAAGMIPKIDSHPAQVDDGVYDISKQILVANQPMGRVLMGFSLSLMDDAIQKSRNRGMTIAFIEIISTITATILIGLGLTRRLSILAKAASEVEAGNYSVSVPTEADDEVGKTAAAFNSMVTEISKRTRQLLQVEKQTQKLLVENRLLINKSLKVQEEERKHIARELHDELGQSITAIQADAESIRDQSKHDERIRVSTNAILKVSAHIYEVVHSMIRLLRPSILDNLGLVEALKDEIDDWSRRNPDTTCTCAFSGDMSGLGEHTEITTYRIIQECLTNIAKHSYADHVDIKLDGNESELHIQVSDDGVGVDVQDEESGSVHGLGLIGMRERVRALNGTFSYQTSPGAGFKVEIRISRQAAS